MGKQGDNNLIQRMSIWKDAFNDPTTGIAATLEQMFWDYAAFLTAIKSIHLANHRNREEGNNSRVPTNTMLFDLLARGYWSHLFLGVRRLLDGGNIAGNNGVNSLRSVVNDIKAKRPRLTRRLYVQHLCNCEYDVEKLDRDEWEAMRASGKLVWWGNPERSKSHNAHRNFDLLSGVKANERTPEDLIDPKIFDQIEARLTKLDHICEHVSSHIAHSGNGESRDEKSLENFDMRDAKEVLKSLKQVTDFIAILLVHEGTLGLATYQGDQFEGLDAAWASTEDLPILADNWDDIERDIGAWSIKPEEMLGTP